MSIDDTKSIDSYSISSVSTKTILGSYSNHIKLGIIGMPNIGKSKLYNLFIKDEIYQHSPCDNYLFCTIDPYMATFIPNDIRFKYICEVVKPKIENPARITLLDTGGIVTGSFKEVGSKVIILSIYRYRMIDLLCKLISLLYIICMIHVYSWFVMSIYNTYNIYIYVIKYILFIKNKGVGVSSLQSLSQIDVILHVLRCFEDEDITHYDSTREVGKYNLYQDVDIVNHELVLLVSSLLL